MKINNEVIGKYALHSNGYGPVMRIIGHDFDNNLNLRYKCEWKENCLTVSSLFRLSDLTVLMEMPAEPFHPRVKAIRAKMTVEEKQYPVATDIIGQPIDPFTKTELDNIHDGLM